MAAFLAQLAVHGILTERSELTIRVTAATVDPVASEHLISRLAAPASPPPRA